MSHTLCSTSSAPKNKTKQKTSATWLTDLPDPIFLLRKTLDLSFTTILWCYITSSIIRTFLYVHCVFINRQRYIKWLMAFTAICFLLNISCKHQHFIKNYLRWREDVFFQTTQGGKEEAKLGQTLNISQALIHYWLMASPSWQIRNQISLRSTISSLNSPSTFTHLEPRNSAV